MILPDHSAIPPKATFASSTASPSTDAVSERAGDTRPGRNGRGERGSSAPSANCPSARTNAFGREAQAFGAARPRPQRFTATVAQARPRPDSPILRITNLMPQSAPLSQRRCRPRPGQRRPKAATPPHRARRPVAGVPPHVRPLTTAVHEQGSPESVWLRAGLGHKLRRPASPRPVSDRARPARDCTHDPDQALCCALRDR